MSLKFVLGAASQDLQKVLFEDIVTRLKKEPNSQYFYIVPDHIKFESEVNLLKYLRQAFSQITNLYAQNNVQTFSFTRLAWYFMKDQAIFQRRHLTQDGLAMVVAHILHGLDAKKLYVFTREQGKPGFATKLAEQLLELKLGGITPSDLDKLIVNLPKQNGQNENLRAKLNDLNLVYQEFVEYLKDDYLDSAQVLAALKKYLETKNLQDSVFIFNGFTHFSALERDVLSVLFKQAKSVEIALTMTKEAINQTQGLFFKQQRLYNSLCNEARQLKIVLEPTTFITDQTRVTPTLQVLEQYWIDTNQLLRDKTYPAISNENLMLVTTNDRVYELRYVASQIRRLVKNGYSYQEILVLTPDMTKYRNLLQPIFQQYQIPVFVDLDKSMIDHPLVEFIMALFAIKRRGFGYHEMMRLLKTELFIPKIGADELTVQEYRGMLDLLENCILQNGYRTVRDWSGDENWVIQKRKPQPNESPKEHLQAQDSLGLNQKINMLRRSIFQQLNGFFKKLTQVTTGQQAVFELVTFLQKIGVTAQLQAWQKAAQEKLQATDASYDDFTRPKQVWDAFCLLLDEYVIALGKEPFIEKEFLDILQSGFESATYSRVPSTLDQVIFSQTSVTQLATRKVTFIIGACDDVMPARVENNMLLTDQDRHLLEKYWNQAESEHKFINDYSELVLADEPFKHYQAFLTPSQRLIFTAPKSDVDGKKLELSSYVKKISDALKLKTIDLCDDIGQTGLAFLGTAQTSLSELITASQEAYEKQTTLDLPWQWLLAYERKKLPALTQQLLQSLNYQNDILPTTPVDENGHKKLAPEIVKKLYGTEIFTSISRLETFYANPYEYFLQYGLRLQPRKEFVLAPADTGEFFHAVLDGFFQNVLQKHATVAELSSQEFDSLMKQTFEQLDEQQRFKVFNSSARYRYTKRQLEKTIYQVSQAIKRQQSGEEIYTLKTETSFGMGGSLPALVYPKDGLQNKMYVRGRIDRLDLVKDANASLYLNVIDYKSGNLNAKMQDFLLKAYNGLSLQLLTYLNALHNLSKTKLQVADLHLAPDLLEKLGISADTLLNLGSVSYLQLLDPIFDVKDLQQGKAQKNISQKYVYQGLYRCADDPSSLDENSYLQALDIKLKQAAQNKKAGESMSYPLKFESGSQSFKAKNQSKLLTLNQFNELLLLNDLKLNEARKQIFEGVIDLAPYKLKDNTGLDYTDYGAIMTFDTLLAANNYHRIEELSEEELWLKIKELLNAEGRA